MKLLLFFTGILVSTLTSCVKSNSVSNLFPIVQNGKMGFIDSTGTVKISPNFDYVGNFHDGLAIAVIDSNYGYINQKGKWAIRPRISLIHYIMTNHDKQFITFGQSKERDSILQSFRHFLTGKHDTVYNFKLPEYLNFNEGLAAIYDNKKGYGFINSDGDTVITPKFKQIGIFKNGLAKAGIQKAPNELFSPIKYGFIQKQGKWSINPEYDDAGDFSEGKATVYLDYEVNMSTTPNKVYNRKSIVINDKNQILFKGDGQYISSFHNGYAVIYNIGYASLYNKGYDYIDSLGMKVCPKAPYGFADCGKISVITNWGVTDSTKSSDFNLLLVKLKIANNDKWCFIQPDLTLPIGAEGEMFYDDANSFTDNLAAIKVDGFWGYINPLGQKVIPIQFTKAKNFYHNLAYVEEINGNLKIYGYINRKGTYVWHGQTKI